MTDLSETPGRRTPPTVRTAVWVALGVVSGLGMSVAAWLLTMPSTGMPPPFPHLDKIQHFLVFAALTGPAVLALPKRYLPFWIGHMLALGVGSEIVQGVIGQGRSADVLDVLADWAGVGAGYVVGRLIRARMERG